MNKIALVIVTLTLPYIANATLTLACFSLPFASLPSISLNGNNPILNTSTFSLGSNVGGASTSVFDICGWGVISYVLLQILPGLLLTQVKSSAKARISNGAKPLTDAKQSEQLTANLHNNQNEQYFVSGLKVAPSLEGNKLQVSPVLATY